MKKRRTNSGILLLLGSLILSMVLLTCASVPLYRIFCKATGYGGTTKRAPIPSLIKNGSYRIRVRFSALTNNFPILFYPNTEHISVIPGIPSLAFYTAKNPSKLPLTGTAVYNVTPTQAGKYFNKIACFCFSQQTFEPEKEVTMPVSFFIDPEIEKDPSTQHIREITLSYIFFPDATQ